MDHRSLLHGQPLSSSAGARPVRDPWSGEARATALLAGPDAVEQALDGAFRARAACAALPPYQRAEILERMAAGVQAEAEALARAIVHEAGKPVVYARAEVERCVQTLREAALEARRPAEEIVPVEATAAGHGRTGIVRRAPAGVLLGIAPFNFPLNLVAHKLAPAIAAGCPFILKPPMQAPGPALVLGRLAVQAGWPAEACQVLLCEDALAQRMVEDERPAVLSFTGSDGVGWRLKALAGRKKVLLELGGSAPVLVLPDADLDLVLRTVPPAAFAYAGQVCISVQRVLVHQAVAPALRERLAAAVEATAWGDPSQPSTVSGPLIDERATDRVEAWTRQALAAGARRLAGGGREGPRLLRPVLLEGVPAGQPFLDRELFGPGLALDTFASLDEAIARLNDGPWGLQAGVFTRDIQALFRLHRELEVGGLIHDDAPTFRVDLMPYGGVKQSGLGREGPRWAIAELTEPRLLVVRA